MDKREFARPRSEYGTAPFWSWNDKLEPTELIRQIHLFKDQGVDGFFMHPRGGLVDHYLGEDFMQAVAACVEEAKKLGMKAWLYDEDRYPSGFAGGKVVKDNPEYQQRVLEMLNVPCREYARSREDIKVFVVVNSSQFRDVTDLAPAALNQLSDDLLIFRVIWQKKDIRFDNQSYTDLCNREAIDKFIAITHEAYKERFGGDFGEVIPGIFTDEPHFSPRFGDRCTLPWTPGLPAAFREKKGYDLLDHLPSLFRNLGDFYKVRFDFWDVISELFRQNFTANILQWCEQNGLQFTGHFWEHIFPLPIFTGSVMPNYEYMHVPGVDILFNTADEQEQVGNDFIVKEVSSVANQLGKKRVLSETYGASGWELSFADQKRIADWQLALGVNLFCQHLSLYSLRGYRKRDYPQSFLDHQPWWDCYHLHAQYLHRLSYALSQGKYTADVLLLHPSSSTWALYSPSAEDERLGKVAQSVKSLVKDLNHHQVLFDLGDDIILERHAKVQGSALQVGEMSYQTIVLPEMLLLRRSTLQLLKDFAQNGGKIIVAGDAPQLLEGRTNAELHGFFKGPLVHYCQPDQLAPILKKAGNAHLTLTDTNGGPTLPIYAHQRQLQGHQLLFLANFSKAERFQTELALPQPCRVESWDALSGEVEELPVQEKDGSAYVQLEFFPAGSHLLVLYPGERPFVSAARPGTFQDSIPLHEWQVERRDQNALTLNTCQAALNGGPWEFTGNVNAVDDTLKDHLGIDRGHVFSRQPWMYSEEEKAAQATLKVRYTFRVNQQLPGELWLAAESPDVFNVAVNGHPIHPENRWYKDRAFVLFDIKKAVRTGENEAILSTDEYGVLVNVESIYVVGDFQVEPDFSLSPEGTLGVGKWTEQGYPFYSGRMVYRHEVDLSSQEYDRAVLELGELWAVVVKVTVNGKPAGILGWPPFAIDISDKLQPGRNTIAVEVMNSLQNLLGPHNYLQPEGKVTPYSFHSSKKEKFVASGFSGRAILKLGS